MIPESPLDVLAQQIVAACSAEEWGRRGNVRAGAARVPVSKSHPGNFDAILEMLPKELRRGAGAMARICIATE
jgi:Lhr-like helicase